ncbi:MAG: hypothetical protein ABR520_00290 [Mycobacteriales bacterium]|nr:alkyl sulfatase [Frankia sp.]
MATIDECEKALHALARELAGVDEGTRRKHVLERTVSCELPDLDVTFFGRLGDDGLTDITRDLREPAQIKLSMNSDDLVALTSGDLALPGAWASGRVRIDASVLDLLKLRSLL